MSEWPCVDCNGTGINRSSKTCPCCHGLGYHGGGQDCNNEQERAMIGCNSTDEELAALRCGKHACTDHEGCRAAVRLCGCEECIAAMAIHLATCPEVTPLPPPMCGEEFTPRGSDYMIRVTCERERGHEGYHGTVPVTEGGTALGDPTTAAIEAGVAERERMRREIADLQRSLDLVHDSDRRGIEMWRAAHPSRALMIPDRATMISWLIEENVKMRDSRAMEHRTHATAETLLANGQRAGKDEIARLRRQVDELTRQRDDADRKLAANAAQLDTFMRGVAHLSIERMRLEREREERPHIYTPGRNLELQARLAAAEQESARRRLRFDECEAACWEAIEMIDPSSGLPYYSERIVDVEVAVRDTIVALLKEINLNREAFAAGAINIGNVTRQLDMMREERTNYERAHGQALRDLERAKPVMVAALEMDNDTTPGLNDDAVERIHRGRADRLRDAVKAYRDSADPGSDAMPF